jgi:hypothetical protein
LAFSISILRKVRHREGRSKWTACCGRQGQPVKANIPDAQFIILNLSFGQARSALTFSACRCAASLSLAAPGAIGVVLLAVEGLSTLMALLAIGLYKLVLWTKK